MKRFSQNAEKLLKYARLFFKETCESSTRFPRRTLMIIDIDTARNSLQHGDCREVLQYHPKADLGPKDNAHLFDKLAAMVKARKTEERVLDN